MKKNEPHLSNNLSSDTKYLTKDEIIKFNTQIGEQGLVINQTALNEAVEAPARKLFGYDVASSLSEKSFEIARPIAQAHPFLEGNKRTATLAVTSFLKKNNKEIDNSNNKKLQDLVNGLVENDPVKKSKFSYEIGGLIGEKITLEDDDSSDVADNFLEEDAAIESFTRENANNSSTRVMCNLLDVLPSDIIQAKQQNDFPPLLEMESIENAEISYDEVFGEPKPISNKY